MAKTKPIPKIELRADGDDKEILFIDGEWIDRQGSIPVTLLARELQRRGVIQFSRTKEEDPDAD